MQNSDAISRGSVLEAIKESRKHLAANRCRLRVADVIRIIYTTPALDVEPAIHSYWISLAPGAHPGIGHGICGNCHQRITLGDHKSRCPNCGAIMDQEVPEEYV